MYVLIFFMRFQYLSYFFFSWKNGQPSYASSFFLCWRLNQIPPTNPNIFALCSVVSHSINNKKSCSSHLSLIIPLLLPSLISSLSRFLLLFLNIYIWNWQETGASKAKNFILFFAIFSTPLFILLPFFSLTFWLALASARKNRQQDKKYVSFLNNSIPNQNHAMPPTWLLSIIKMSVLIMWIAVKWTKIGCRV